MSIIVFTHQFILSNLSCHLVGRYNEVRPFELPGDFSRCFGGAAANVLFWGMGGGQKHAPPHLQNNGKNRPVSENLLNSESNTSLLCECNDSMGEIRHFLSKTDDRAGGGDAESANEWSCHLRRDFALSEGD